MKGLIAAAKHRRHSQPALKRATENAVARAVERMTRIGSLMATVAPSVGSLIGPRWIVISVALLLVACESPDGPRLPTAPSPPSVTVPSPDPPAGRTHTLSGVVTAGGQPAVGARVAVLEVQPEPSATTDDKGYYSIPGLATSSFWGRTLVRFSQPGYFTVFERRTITSDTQLDVVLDPLVFIALGDVVRGTVMAGDATCAGQDYEEDACQRFAVIPPVAGTLEVTLTSRVSPGLWALDLVNPEGDGFAEFSGSPKRLTIPARAGGAYEIRVVAAWGSPVEFELMTSLR